jgi:hypothetical protein
MSRCQEEEFEWIETQLPCRPLEEEFCSLILYEETSNDFKIDNYSPPSLISLREDAIFSDLGDDSDSESEDSYQLMTLSEEFQSQQQIEAEVQRTLSHCIYLFSVKGKEDLRTISFAPIKLIYEKVGFFSTVSRTMMQEFIDMFKTLKMIVLKVDEAKVNGRWSLFWNYSKWSQDVYSISNEIHSFFHYLEEQPKNSIAEDHSLLNYSPGIRIKSVGLRLRPSLREKTREELWKRYHRPISFQAVNIQWFLDLFYLFDTYLEWFGQVDLVTLLHRIQMIFSELTCTEQQNLIVICEDVLGGIALSHISTNLTNWIYLNKDIIPPSILCLIKINT